MIRVTPIDGEPIEVQDDTECTAEEGEEIMPIQHMILWQGEFTPNAFVHIGDRWLHCTIETWRQRAERLEQELATLRKTQ